jgi:hypothetical protein
MIAVSGTGDVTFAEQAAHCSIQLRGTLAIVYQR